MRLNLLAALCLSTLLPAIAFAGSFGLEPMPEGEATPVKAALSEFDRHAQGRQKFSGRIVEVCQNKGCWVVLEDQGESVRVMMHDHKFDVPKDSSGPAVVYGQLARKELSEDHRQHLQDESTRGIEVAKVEYRIDAFAVEIADGTAE